VENEVWKTTICSDCGRISKCMSEVTPCLALEMLRRMTLEEPETQVEMLQNVARYFIYGEEMDN